MNTYENQNDTIETDKENIRYAVEQLGVDMEDLQYLDNNFFKTFESLVGNIGKKGTVSFCRNVLLDYSEETIDKIVLIITTNFNRWKNDIERKKNDMHQSPIFTDFVKLLKDKNYTNEEDYMGIRELELRLVNVFAELDPLSNEDQFEKYRIMHDVEIEYNNFKEYEATKIEKEKDLEHNPITKVVDDDEAIDAFYSRIKDIIVFSGDIYYMKINNLWYPSLSKMKEERLIGRLSKMCRKTNIIKPTKKNPDEKYASSISVANRIAKAVLFEFDDNEKFSTLLVESTRGKLCFKNGIYCFETKQLKSWDKCPDVHTTIIINDNFDESIPPKSDLKKMHDILDSILGDKKEDYLRYQARGLAGHVTDKRWGINLGERNSGKSVLTDLFKKSFGKYVGIIDANNLLCTKSNHGGDSAKKLSFIIDVAFCRLVFTNEIKIDEENKLKIDGNLIKQFCSAGDEIVARKNFKDEAKFYLQCTFTLNGNDFPKITPLDSQENMLVFSCPYKFVTQQELDNNSDVTFLRLADDDIYNKIAQPNMIAAFRYILFSYYSPKKPILSEAIKNEIDTYVDGSSDLFEFFRVFKYKKGSFVSDETLIKYIENNDKNISITKMKKRLSKLNKDVRKEKIDGVPGYINIEYIGDDLGEKIYVKNK
jgi:hypothetical protein